ncbi:hypothetical protein AYO39_02405 [Actinobacteria bacterium SCGC AG-212-D09]|nr:hypothetical protein AYO39_02405 [Actinobacteria bacterium SCGC AG-212-D09]
MAGGIACLSAAPAAAAPTILESNTVGVHPDGITVGSDGHLWWTDDGKLGEGPQGFGAAMVPTSFFSTTTGPSTGNPVAIAAGRTGTLWFTTSDGFLGKETLPATGGPVFGSPPIGHPQSIVNGPDGALYATAVSGTGALCTDPGCVIDRIDQTSGATTTSTKVHSNAFAFDGDGSAPASSGIVSANGALYFVEPGIDGIAKYDPGTNAVTQIAHVPSIDGFPTDLTMGADGKLWFTEPGAHKIGSMTPSGGSVSQYSTSGSAERIATGPDGNVWFTEPNVSEVGRVTQAGKLTEYATPTASSSPTGITAQRGGMAITETKSGKLAGITVGPASQTGAASAITSTGATIAGQLNPNGSATSWVVQYGTTTSYGTSTTKTNAGTGFSSVRTSVNLTGLTPNTTYHYRLVATNSTDTTYGADRTFNTTTTLAKAANRRTHGRAHRHR